MAVQETSPNDLPLGKYRHPETGAEVELKHQSLASAFKKAGFVHVVEQPATDTNVNKKEGK